MPESRGGVLVAGSVHIDEILELDHCPGAGETVVARSSSTAAGGKGANQAVAAARWGAAVAMVGCVGSDPEAEALHDLMAGEGIDIRWLVRRSGPSGRAIILVEPRGENRIIVAPGASGTLRADDVLSVSGHVCPAVVVVQAEVGQDVTAAAAVLASETGARFVLNLAPYRQTPDELLARSDPLVVNESELRALAGDETRHITPASVRALLAGRVRSAVVTLGAAGALVLDGDGATTTVPAPEVHVVDTTGAGDTLVGVVAAGLARGASLLAATREAVQAAARSVTVPGAQPSIPHGPRTTSRGST